MNHYTRTFISAAVLISLVQPGLFWTFYEQEYQGNKDGVCGYDENKNRYCKNLGEHAYRGQLVNGIPKPISYFLHDAELYEELQLGRDYDIFREPYDMLADDVTDD